MFVIETTEIHDGEMAKIPNPDQSFSNKQGTGAHRIALRARLLRQVLVNTTMWANASKVFAIVGTALISYLGMYLWVFVSKAQKEQTLSRATVAAHRTASGERRSLPAGQRRDVSYKREQFHENGNGDKIASSHSLSVALPAYNEEQVIASTFADVLDVLNIWRMDVEVLVVNDGSTDRTGAIVAALADAHPPFHLITHPTNQGYGAALVSGFVAAKKELTFFMDADGQFDIRDLQQFFPFIDEYNAVIGYRLDRQDSWMRKLHPLVWKRLIGWGFGGPVRDIDCAFKLLHTEFLHQHPLETRGAMINAELLYRLTQAGYSYREIGVHHHPRQAGRPTGARPSVILRAMCELFVYTRKWHRENREHSIPGVEHKLRPRSRAR